MPPFQRHLFICTNRRAEDHHRGCCAAGGSEAIRAAFKLRLAELGLKGQVRANSAGCLDSCELGPTVVVYPEGVWYARVKLSDVEEIIQRHIVGGEVVQRLLLERATPCEDGN